MKHIKQNYRIPASAEEVYIALTNPFTIELWTGFEATMSTEPGSEFSMWEGDISGKNLKFIENELIQQEWYFGEQEEQSIVTIKLKQKGESTEVELFHENVPDDEFEDLKQGWREYYFGNIKKFFK